LTHTVYDQNAAHGCVNRSKFLSLVTTGKQTTNTLSLCCRHRIDQSTTEFAEYHSAIEYSSIEFIIVSHPDCCSCTAA